MNKEKQKSRVRSVFVISFVTGALCLFLLALVFHNFVFVIENIRVEDNTRSEAQSIIEASGIVVGEPMYSINKNEIYEMIKKENPYVENISVKRELPSDIRIIVSDSSPSCYANVAGEYFILSDSLRVLEYTDDEEYAKNISGRRIIFPKLGSMIVGEKISLFSFADTSYISGVMEAIAFSELSERIDIVSVKNKFGIYAVCDELYRIEFGSSEDMPLKLEVAHAIIESGKLESGVISVIDVSNPSEGSVISDKTQVLVPDDR